MEVEKETLGGAKGKRKGSDKKDRYKNVKARQIMQLKENDMEDSKRNVGK
jgi:hypothetical protein